MDSPRQDVVSLAPGRKFTVEQVISMIVYKTEVSVLYLVLYLSSDWKIVFKCVANWQTTNQSNLCTEMLVISLERLEANDILVCIVNS